MFMLLLGTHVTYDQILFRDESGNLMTIRSFCVIDRTKQNFTYMCKVSVFDTQMAYVSCLLEFEFEWSP